MKKTIYFLILIFLASFVTAVKPSVITQNNDGLNGLELRVGLFEPLKQYENHTFNTHIFNGLDGTGLNDDRSVVNCSFHLYNDEGEHIIMMWSETFDDIWDVEFMVEGSNFDYLGEYGFIIQCECVGCGVDQVNLGGFISQTFIVNESGEQEEFTSLWGVAILIIGVLCILAYISRNTEDDVIKGLFSLITVGLLFAVMDMARVFAVESAASNFFIRGIVIIEITVGTLMIATLLYTGIRFIHTVLLNWLKMRKEPKK